MTSIAIERTNAVENPRAHVDVSGFSVATRITEPPVALPDGADACFGVPAGTGSGGGSNGITVASSWYALPAGSSSGDWLAVQLQFYVDGVAPGDVVFWCDLQFRDAGQTSQGWVPWGRSIEPPVAAFERVAGVVQIQGEAATQFRLYMKIDDNIFEGANDADLYFTLMQVEAVAALNMAIPDYADGDTEGWEWSGTAHDSSSVSLPVQAIIDDIDPTIRELTGDDEYTFFPLDDNYALEVLFGPLICQIYAYVWEGSGTLLPASYSEVVNGEPFTLSWVADEGYELSKLEIDDVEVSPTGEGEYAFDAVYDHHTVKVYLTKIEYDVTYAAGANGSITGDASQSVPHGTSASAVQAVADEAYHFTTWSDAVLTPGRIDSMVTAAISVEATFELDDVPTYTLTYTADANGTISGDATQEDVPEGTDGTPVTAVPNADYHFVSWNDGYTNRAIRTDVLVNADVTAQAVFAADVTWDLTYTAGAGGSISGDLSQEVLDGENGTLVTAVPEAGHQFANWSDDRVVAPRRDLNVKGDISVTAYFDEDPIYDLTYTAGTGGTISGTASQRVVSGGRGTMVTAVPSAGYVFVAWSDGKSTASRIEVGVGANVAVSASFALANMSLRYRAIGGGTISGSNPQTVAYGANGTEVEAVPDANHRFSVWSDEVATAKRTDLVVHANIRVHARFALDEHTLTYSAGSGGTLRGDASQSIKYGRQGMPVTAIPAPGYHFTQWSDAVMTARRREVNVTDNIAVTASFAADTP